MKLRYFDVERFGSWDSMQLGDLADGLTVVYGPNGSGKTTLMQFVRAVFYGSPNPGSHRFLPVLHQGRQGGRLGVSASGRELVVSRLWDESAEPDSVVLTAPDGSVVSSHSLKSLLGDLREDVFEAVFTVGYREAEDLGVIVREALADEEQVAPGEELVEVEAAMAKIDQAVDQLDGLLEQRQRMTAEITRLESVSTLPGDDLVRLRHQIAELERTLGERRNRIASLKDEIARYKSMPVASDEDAFAEPLSQLELKISNYRMWQCEVEEQLAHTRHQLHRHSLRDAEPAVSSPAAQRHAVRQSMTAVERQAAALETQLATSMSLQNDTRDAVQAELKQLRGQVHELCAQLSQHELLDEIASVEAESLQLERVRCELKSQIGLLESRRTGLLAAYAGNAEPGWQRYAHKQHGNCQSLEHAAWLGKPVPAGPASNVDQLIAEHDRLAELLGEEQGRLAELNQRRTYLEQQLSNTDVARRLEALRFDLNVVEEEIRSATEARAVRATTRALLDELRVEYESRRISLVLLEASRFLTRLSGEDIGLRADADRRSIMLHRPSRDPRALSALSHGERDQVALSLRLALVRAYARQGTRLPLILDDVFITSDSATAGATARLLQDFAVENQVLFFTCHVHIADMFRQLGVAVRNLPEQDVQVARPEPVQTKPKSIVTKITAEPREPMRLARKEPVVTAPWVNPAESLVVKAFRNEVEELTDIEVGARLEPGANWIFYTELTTPTAELSGITSEQAVGLADCGVRTVEDLIAMVPSASVSQLANLGLAVDQIHAWQAQAMLSCRVPMLHRRDAALLVRSGITSPEQLAEAHPESIYESVATYLASPDGSRFVKPSSPFDRQTAINWVRWSAHARTLWHSRENRGDRETSQQRIHNAVAAYRGRATTSREQSRTRATTTTGSPTESRDGNGTGSGSGEADGSRSSSRSIQRSESRSRSRRKRASSNRTRASRTRSERSERKRSTRSDTQSQRAERSSKGDADNAEVRTLKFYLKRDAPVEDAPSIGPRTAEHLSKVRIVTVKDLLDADSEAAADELNHRRIKPKTIRDWQNQALMVCRIPELRGHDAQVLVACDVTTPEELAGYRPNDLFAIVAPFVATAEGERIIRNGKKPNLEEVTFWIDCAKRSRALKAA